MREGLITRKAVLKWVVAVVLVFLLAALVVAIARDSLVASQVSNTASFHELQGIQGADTTQNVAEQKKAKKAGKTAEAKELGEIRRQKVAHFQIISAAQATQNRYYEANTSGTDASGLRSELERRIPEARASLVELKALTDRELALLKTIGGDEAAFYIVKAFYKAMETAVNSLQLDELTDQQVEARRRDIDLEGKSAIATAHQMARRFDAEEMETDEKAVLDQDVVVPGEQAVKGLGDVLSKMPQIIWATVQGALESYDFANKALQHYDNSKGGLEQMMHDLAYGQGMFNRNAMNQHQKRMDVIGAGVHQFLETYSPFVKTVGHSIGREADVNALGYGEDIIIRFADLKGRLYIVREDEHMRVLVDKLQTKWDSDEHEVRSMIIYEYDDAGVESVVEDFKRFAPGFDRYLRNARIAYVYKGYRPSIWKSFLYEVNFQNADGQEQGHYRAEGIPKGEYIHRRSWDDNILRTILAVSPPKNPNAIAGKPGWTSGGGKKNDGKKPARNAETPRKKKEEAKKPSRPPTSSKKGTIQPPSEGVETLEAMNADKATKSAILEEHNRGLENFNAGKYELALRQFGRAAKMHEENYLDAYWAALAAHNAKNTSAVKEWLDRCLQIKKDYLPALEMKKALKLK
ncbi:MAG: hypothetical protein LBO68_03145 [Synergistaceae bacterium]|jgi:hypothetical protein|nr:hypothetical protein [Synergistaceae bacterium]